MAVYAPTTDVCKGVGRASRDTLFIMLSVHIVVVYNVIRSSYTVYFSKRRARLPSATSHYHLDVCM